MLPTADWPLLPPTTTTISLPVVFLKDLRQRTTLNDVVPKSCSCWYGPFSFLSLEWWEACLCVCVCHDCDCNSWPKWNHANQISLSVCLRSRDCLWFYLIFCSWWYVSHAVSNVWFKFSYFGNWTLIIKPKMARWGVGFSWQEQQWPSIWFLNLVRQSGGWWPAT